MGRFDPRIEADNQHLPWSAVALLLIPRVSRCTAVAVAPHWMAAAAHCLFNRSLGRVVPADSVHLLIEYRSGEYARLVFPDAIRLASGADPAFRGVRGSDLALLHVADILADTLPPVVVAPGTRVQLGGFGQDRAERLVVDPDCVVSAIVLAPDGRDVARHDCSGTRGTSGGAVVVQTGPGSWALAGVQVAAEMGRSSGYAVPGGAVAALLEAVRADAPPHQGAAGGLAMGATIGERRTTRIGMAIMGRKRLNRPMASKEADSAAGTSARVARSDCRQEAANAAMNRQANVA